MTNHTHISVAYYSGPDRRWLLAVGIYLLPLAAIAFIWFITALRVWMAEHGRPEHALLSNIQLACGIVYIALMLVAAAAFTVDSAIAQLEGGTVDPQSARNFPEFGKLVLVMLAMRMAAMFVFTTARPARLLPAWFIWLSYPVGLFLLLAATLSIRFVVVFPAWILTLAILLMVRVPRTPAAVTAPSDSAAAR